MVKILNHYYVGKNHPYENVNQVLNTIKSDVESGDYTLPDSSLPDGGNINIVLVGGGIYPPIKVPNNLTSILAGTSRYLKITRQEYIESGKVNVASVPIISPLSSGASEAKLEDKLICVNLGSNNPNIKITGVRIQDGVMGIVAGNNCNNLHINRSFITNCSNTQVYAHDSDGLYMSNNLVIGGEYGIVSKNVKKPRIYHNTILVNGSTAFSGKAKAGVLIQGERTFGSTSPGTIYFAGNLVYTVGAPCLIVYQGDLDNERLVSDYNDLFNTDGPIVQLRQDTTQQSDESEIIKAEYSKISEWNKAGTLGAYNFSIDGNSISSHPVFIKTLAGLGSTDISVIDLSLLQSSPILEKVPSWFFTSDPIYIPNDFDTDDIATDALLIAREKPYTAIGANDAPSNNGFFGADIFTSPLSLDPEKSCDINPIKSINYQSIDMVYPQITAGYFWSHERPYYLYATKGASQIGFLARTKFRLPEYIDSSSDIKISVKNIVLDTSSWNIIGKDLYVSYDKTGLESSRNEVQVECNILGWDNNGFFKKKANYVFKVEDGKTEFILPEYYQSSGPVVITDDRISYKDPIDLVRREFKVEFDSKSEENKIKFLYPDNLIENPSFDITYSFTSPSYWDTTNVSLVGGDFPYYGEMCAGLSLGTTQGVMVSNKIPVEDEPSLSISWHARLPINMDFSGASPSYYIGWEDKDNNQIALTTGTFDVTASGYNRYHMSFVSSDVDIDYNIFESFTAPTILVRSGDSIPSGATHAYLTLSGSQESSAGILLIDAVQAEHSVVPSYYHPNVDYQLMTVEYESSDSSIFTDKRLNITNLFNENPNGFLYIQDMPASIWGGPDYEETTTLNEYRWPVGRLLHLPWARLHGKDKLKQRYHDSDAPVRPLDIISPLVRVKRPVSASMVPEPIVASQTTGDYEGFNIRVIDEDGNPYSMRKYSLSVHEANNQFPGWVSKRHLGAKEQLGSTIFGQLNSNGAVNGFYTGPDNSFIKYVGKMPKASVISDGLSGAVDTVSYVKVPYTVNTENNGNVTVKGYNGQIHNAVGSQLSGQYYAISDSDTVRISLEYPPELGSIKVLYGDKLMEETFSEPYSDEFYVNYPYAQLEFQNGIDTTIPFDITYSPMYVYPDPGNKNEIIIHNNKVFGDYDGPIEINYDAEIFIELRVQQPLTGEFVNTFSIVLQNPDLGSLTDNSASLEF